MQVDPFVSLLIGVFGATALGFIGAWIQSRREHSKWILEQRYDAHLAFLTLLDRHATNAKLDVGPKTKAEVAAALEGVSTAVSTMSLVGPESLLDMARPFRDEAADILATGTEPKGFAAARAAYISAAREVLRVSGRR